MHKLKQLTQKMTQQNISNMIISDPYSIRYLVDYFTEPGERLFVLLVKENGEHHLILNQLFPPTTKSADYHTIYYGDGEDIINQLAKLLLPGQTSIDKYWPSHFLLDLMTKKDNLKPVNASNLLDDLRSIKSNEEINIMREASQLNDEAMAEMIKLLNRNYSEKEMANHLQNIYEQSGHTGFSFEPIIAYGPHGADPHHTNSVAKPKPGDVVVIDIGGKYKNYTSDMTRTVFYGEPTEEALHIYNIVKQANEAAISAVRPGLPLSEIDKAARDIIEEAGYGQYFTHRLGHFIGQEAHEAGDVSQFNREPAQIGQVFSIEPGIYLPNKFGVRIEDLVLVTEEGCEVLNHYTKEPIIIEPN